LTGMKDLHKYEQVRSASESLLRGKFGMFHYFEITDRSPRRSDRRISEVKAEKLPRPHGIISGF